MRKIIQIALTILLIACSKDSTDPTPAPTPAPTPKYSLTISASEGGSVSSTGGSYEQGTEVSVTATPDDEYIFNGWSDGNNDNPRVITVTSNKTITANFIKKKYELTINIEGEGAVQEEIIVQGTTSEYNSGSTIRLTANPSEGWQFSGWSGDIESEENPIEVDITETKTVTAIFTPKSFDLNVTIQGEGAVQEEIISQPSQYKYSSIIRLTAIPSDNWRFSGWSGSLDSEENPIDITIEGTTEIIATFILLDDDGDGVPNYIDQCPDTPQGYEVNEDGCADTDSDGVIDILDQCPDTPQGSLVDENGCADSQKDTDNDGVTDDLDLCPDTSAGDSVFSSGCSNPGLTFGSEGNDLGSSIIETSDGSLIFTGYKRLTNNEIGLVVIKTDNRGALKWEKLYSGSSGVSIHQLKDDNFIITGAIKEGENFTGYVLKIDSNGDVIWEKSVGNNYENFLRSSVETDQGNLLFFGDTWNENTNKKEFWLLKTDSSGNTIWEKKYEGQSDSNYVRGSQLKITSDGGYVMIGESGQLSTCCGGDLDIYLIKTNSQGEIEWQREFTDDQVGIFRGYEVLETAEEELIIIGSLLRKVDKNGNSVSNSMEWNKGVKNLRSAILEGTRIRAITSGGQSATQLINFNSETALVTYAVSIGERLNNFNQILKTSDGNYILIGTSFLYGNGGGDIYLMKINSYGTTIW